MYYCNRANVNSSSSSEITIIKLEVSKVTVQYSNRRRLLIFFV